MPGPTLNAVMGLLGVCGADASAIKGIVDAYTKRPPITEEGVSKQVAATAVGLPLMKRARVEWYDLFHKPKTGKPETPEQERVVAEALKTAPEPALTRELAVVAESGMDKYLKRTPPQTPPGKT